ncbi:MAG: aminotransferase class III-fold pyridoxal phosphate-dependent enzyme, partial [Thalassobaculaceae bacterium]
ARGNADMRIVIEDGVAPDLLIVAKGLGAGFQPIGATLVARHVFQAIRDGSGFFQHGHTYMGHPAACAAALAVQEVIDAEDLLANVRRRGAELRAALNACFAGHPHVGDIRGRGLFLALELVADRASKRPFDPALKVHQRVKAAAMANGLMVYPSGGTVDGVSGDHVLLAPPFIVDDALVAMIVDRLAASIADSLPAATAASA